MRLTEQKLKYDTLDILTIGTFDEYQNAKASVLMRCNNKPNESALRSFIYKNINNLTCP